MDDIINEYLSHIESNKLTSFEKNALCDNLIDMSDEICEDQITDEYIDKFFDGNHDEFKKQDIYIAKIIKDKISDIDFSEIRKEILSLINNSNIHDIDDVLTYDNYVSSDKRFSELNRYHEQASYSFYRYEINELSKL